MDSRISDGTRAIHPPGCHPVRLAVAGGGYLALTAAHEAFSASCHSCHLPPGLICPVHRQATNILTWDIGVGKGGLAGVEKSIRTAEYQRLCMLLRQIRVAANLTQVQVAEQLGEPQSFVSKYESGERRLDILELKRVVEVCGVTLVEFVGWL